MVFRNDNTWPALKGPSHRAEDGSRQRGRKEGCAWTSHFSQPPPPPPLAIGPIFHALGGVADCWSLSASQACSAGKRPSRRLFGITGQSGVWKICRVSICSASVLGSLREGLLGAHHNCFLMEQGLTNKGGGTGGRGAADTLGTAADEGR